MPRYFFHVQDGKGIPDDVGTVYADPEAARLAAVVASGEMLRGHASEFWRDRHWRMHVTDEQGGTVCDLHFRDAADAPIGTD